MRKVNQPEYSGSTVVFTTNFRLLGLQTGFTSRMLNRSFAYGEINDPTIAPRIFALYGAEKTSQISYGYPTSVHQCFGGERASGLSN